MNSKKVALIILDGWGHGDHSESDGIFNAQTPFMDELEQNAPHAELLTHGEHVGLPDGQMGNSEVGHLNIGAGRIVYQELTRINKAIREGEFQKNAFGNSSGIFNSNINSLRRLFWWFYSNTDSYTNTDSISDTNTQCICYYR